MKVKYKTWILALIYLTNLKVVRSQSEVGQTRCQKGYHLEGNTCQPNQCQCHGGEALQNCQIHHGLECKKCQDRHVEVFRTDLETGFVIS